MSRLAEPERELLLRLARASILNAVLADGSLDDLLGRTAIPDALERRRGAFVTLKRRVPDNARETLRGCIGTMGGGGRPLYRSVIEMTEAAALRDPRFPPLDPGELEATRIEISVLGRLRPIAGVDDVVVGRHGVQLTLGKARSVFLPQVAAEQRWSARELLERLARKAGLDAGAWSRGALAVFETESFSEPHLLGG